MFSFTFQVLGGIIIQIWKSPDFRYILDFPALFLTGKVLAQGTSWIFSSDVSYRQEESKHKVYP